MPSIYIHDGAKALTLRIVGPFTEAVAVELEQTWLTARSTVAGRDVIVDLRDEATVEGGHALLRRLSGDGVRILTQELLPAPRPGIWSRLTGVLKAFCGSALVPCASSARKL